MSNLRIALRETSARRLFAAHAQSCVGSGMAFVALPLLAYEFTGSAWAGHPRLLPEITPAIPAGTPPGPPPRPPARRGPRPLRLAPPDDLRRHPACAGLPAAVAGRSAADR